LKILSDTPAKRSRCFPKANKKADVEEHPGVFHHVGILNNGLPSVTGSPFS
jgi:hypothetical protein